MFQGIDDIKLQRIKLLHDINNLAYPIIQQLTIALLQKLSLIEHKNIFTDFEFNYIQNLIKLQANNAALFYIEDVKFQDV